MMRLFDWMTQNSRNARVQPTASDAARALARVKPEEQRKRVLRNMQELRRQMGMPPAKVSL